MSGVLRTADTETLEVLFRLLSQAIEDAGADNERLYLAKLSMVMASHIGDVDVVREATAIALRDL